MVCENVSAEYIKVLVGLLFFLEAVVEMDIISGGSPLYALNLF